MRRLETYQRLLQQPLSIPARLLLVVAVFAIPFVFWFPLWTMSFESNQYPDPLRLAIHVDHLDGQKTAKRDDLREINSLNHYIGMRPLLESDFSEFVWMPFVMGFFALLGLRAAVLGSLRDAADLAVATSIRRRRSTWSRSRRQSTAASRSRTSGSKATPAGRASPSGSWVCASSPPWWWRT
jgi:hypothetical protein